MKVCQFNFNNEVSTFTIHVEDDGRVIVPGENGEVLASYDNVQQFAETYALARDVKPDNLKNWKLLQNGSVYTYVLRAGTAGVDVNEVEERLEDVFASLSGKYHALSIARAKEQIMSDGARDLTEALIHCAETDIARDVYDAMNDVINGTDEQETPAEPEEVDDRTEMQKYLDEMEEVPGALAFIAAIVNMTPESTKDEIREALEASYAFNNVSNLKVVYESTVSNKMKEGIGVANEVDALTVITQTPAGKKDDEAKNRMMVSARLAGRSSVNVSVDIVGSTHIRHTAELVSLADLETMDMFMRGNVPYVVRFSDTIDEELEAERDAAARYDDYTVDGHEDDGADDDYEDDDDYEADDYEDDQYEDDED